MALGLLTRRDGPEQISQVRRREATLAGFFARQAGPARPLIFGQYNRAAVPGYLAFNLSIGTPYQQSRFTTHQSSTRTYAERASADRMSTIDEVKSRIDIVELVNESGVKLRKSGRNYTGFCPFHANKNTPAFVVWPESGTWRCFGECNEGGDVFKFLMKKEGIDFREALRL